MDAGSVCAGRQMAAQEETFRVRKCPEQSGRCTLLISSGYLGWVEPRWKHHLIDRT
jgi:hypothetical protein